MGTIQHDFALAVVNSSSQRAQEAFEKVKAFARDKSQEDAPFFADFESLLVGPIESVVNFSATYLMVPDGSKEWWSTSDIGNEIRYFFVETMTEAGAEVARVSFGELGSSLHLFKD